GAPTAPLFTVFAYPTLFRSVPHLELVLEVDGGVPERPPLEPDVGPLAVVQPLDVVGGADVDVAVVDLALEGALEVGGDGLGLGDLLGPQAVMLVLVLEVRVAGDVELVRAVRGVAAVLDQLGHHAVRYGRAVLALVVVTDDRDAGGAELFGPLGVGGDEHGQGVDKGHAGVDAALRVELVGLLRAHGQVGQIGRAHV